MGVCVWVKRCFHSAWYAQLGTLQGEEQGRGDRKGGRGGVGGKLSWAKKKIIEVAAKRLPRETRRGDFFRRHGNFPPPSPSPFARRVTFIAT